MVRFFTVIISLFIFSFSFSACSPVRLYLEIELDGPEALYATQAKEVNILMPDGKMLSALETSPTLNGRYPIILVRMPLPDTFKMETIALGISRYWASRGFAVIFQRLRGWKPSEGDYQPFINERADGEATLSWLSKQSYYDGEIYSWGGSIFGYTQSAITDLLPPKKSGMIIQISSSDPKSFFYDNGMFRKASALYWAARDKLLDPDFDSLSSAALISDPKEALAFFGVDSKVYEKWLIPDSAYWSQISSLESLRNSKAPALFMAGLSDPFLESQLRDYAILKNSKDPYVSKNTKLIIGPWSHAYTVEQPNQVDPEGYRLQSLKYVLPYICELREMDCKQSALPNLLRYVAGADDWKEDDKWPPDPDGSKQFFLYNSELSANANKLKEGTLSLLYDSKDPVRRSGGAFLGPGSGPVLNPEEYKHKDLLSFESEPLEESLEFVGQASLALNLSFENCCGDIIAQVVDVGPQNQLSLIASGAQRVFAPKECLNGSKQILNIKLTPMSYFVKKGHSIKLFLSSSDSPRYDFHPQIKGNARSELYLNNETVLSLPFVK